MSNRLTGIVNRVTDWVSASAEQYLYADIPLGRTDSKHDDAPLKPYQSYFRVWLSDMFLTTRRSWFTSWCPAVHASVSLNYGGQQSVSFDKVTGLPEDLQSRGVLLNYNLSELMPFNGGTVEITASLLAMPMKGDDFLKTAVAVFGDFANLVAPPLGSALAISKKVAGGIEKLMNATGGQIHAGWHQKLNSDGGGGAHLRPGYQAVIMATANQIDESRLSVRNDRLHYRADDYSEPRPLVGYDYMLFRIEGRRERDDWRLKDIQDPMDNAIKALLRQDQAEADAYRLMALTNAFTSADLAVHDRRRVVEAIKSELAQVQGAGLGIMGSDGSTLNDIMARQATDVTSALALPPISFAEVVDH